MPDVDAVDVSHYQDAPGGPPSSGPQWSLVHGAGLQLVAAKCCQAGVLDPEFHGNWTAMRSYDDWCRVAYVFADDDMPAVEQVTKFRKHVGAEWGPRDGIMVDVEVTKTVRPVTAAFAYALLAECEHQFQRTPFCYIGNFYPGDVDQNAAVQAFPWWLPWYRGSLPPWPRTPAIWQWGAAQIPGIARPCDANQIVSPLVVLAACGWPTSPVPVPPSKPSEVRPVFDPPQVLAPIVDQQTPPSGQGVWLLGQDGGVYCYGGAQFFGAPAGNSYWGGRKAARFDKLNEAERAAGKHYVVLSTANERYAF